MSRPTPSLPQSVIALRAVTQARSTQRSSAVSNPIRAAALSLVHVPDEAEPTEVPAPNPAKPYEVRIRRGVGSAACLVGHNRHGTPMVELRVHTRHVTPSMVKNMEQWCRDHDDNALTLV